MYTEAEYTHLLEGMHAYAMKVATSFFQNQGQRDASADKAMETVEDWLMTNPQGIEHSTAYIKTIIRNSIRRSSKSRKSEYDGSLQDDMSAFRIVKGNKLLKVRISKITGSSAKTVMTYYSQGLRQIDIARKLDVSRPYICKVVKKWTV